MRPTVSVVIPCYNVASFVENAVASALAQTLPPVEVICVDDGSTDETLDVLRELEHDHAGMVSVIAQANAGACSARNAGLAAATGEWVEFLDADDRLHPTKIEHQLAVALEGTCDLVCGGYERVNGSTSRVMLPEASDDDWENLVMGRCGITSANLWRREAVLAVGGWEDGRKGSQEYELMFRLLRSDATVCYSEAVLTTLLTRPGSISNDFDLPARQRHLDLRRDIIQHLKRENADVAHKKAMLENVFYMIRKVSYMDAGYAVEMHKTIFDFKFTPEVNSFNTRPYVLAYRLFGYETTERLRRWTRKR